MFTKSWSLVLRFKGFKSCQMLTFWAEAEGVLWCHQRWICQRLPPGVKFRSEEVGFDAVRRHSLQISRPGFCCRVGSSRLYLFERILVQAAASWGFTVREMVSRQFWCGHHWSNVNLLLCRRLVWDKIIHIITDWFIVGSCLARFGQCLQKSQGHSH